MGTYVVSMEFQVLVEMNVEANSEDEAISLAQDILFAAEAGTEAEIRRCGDDQIVGVDFGLDESADVWELPEE